MAVGVADREGEGLGDRALAAAGGDRLAQGVQGLEPLDVLAVDAFSGDSVPIHLLTTQAMAVYERHMQATGVIAFHVTNRFLSLAPVVRQVAEARGLHAVLVHDEAEGSDLRRTDWVLVARDAAALAAPQIAGTARAIPEPADRAAWTDDFNHLLGALK